jgi:hypothetical protein
MSLQAGAHVQADLTNLEALGQTADFKIETFFIGHYLDRHLNKEFKLKFCYHYC